MSSRIPVMEEHSLVIMGCLIVAGSNNRDVVGCSIYRQFKRNSCIVLQRVVMHMILTVVLEFWICLFSTLLRGILNWRSNLHQKCSSFCKITLFCKEGDDIIIWRHLYMYCGYTFSKNCKNILQVHCYKWLFQNIVIICSK